MNKKTVSIEDIKTTTVEIITPTAEKQIKGGLVIEDDLAGF